MQSIQTLMQTLEDSPQWRENAGLRRVLAQWPRLVGEAVAQHSRPTKIYRQVLQVSVSSSAWSQTLTFERSRILQKLHTTLPDTHTTIQDLRFATADWQRLVQRSHPTQTLSLNQHPSWAGNVKSLRHTSPRSAKSAFQQWAQLKQTQLASQSQCPRCQTPCPTQEIQRWGICSVCMAQQWHTLQTQNRQR